MNIEDSIKQIVTSEIKAEIASLKAEIALLKNQLTTQVSTPKYIFGDKALATFLHKSQATIARMNKSGILDEARFKINRHGNSYDIDKVMNILKYNN